MKISQGNAWRYKGDTKLLQMQPAYTQQRWEKNQSSFDEYFWKSNTVCYEESGKRSENKQKEDLS